MGYPIDFQVYSGCSAETKTMPASIRKMQDKYKVEDTIVVADRGLNSVDNLQMLLDENLGFLVAQKVTVLDKDTTAFILDAQGYTEFKDDKTQDVLWKYKTLENYRRTGKGGKSVECSLILTWSTTRAARDLKQLELDIEKAKKAVSQKDEISISHSSWRSLVVASGKKTATGMNNTAIEKRRSLCGYAAVVYHNKPGSKKL